MLGGRTLSLAQARRIALAAQGFADRRSTVNPNRGHLSRLTDRLGVVQIDSVNVLARSHYLPGFARLGAYERGHLEDLAWGRRPRLFEYWGHEASLLPLDLQPFFRWRMEDAAAGKGIYRGLVKFARENRDFIQAIKREIEVKGPSGAGKLEGSGKGEGGWWGWSPGKIALEWLFWAGEITTKTRNNFERIYDLTERAIPADVLSRPTPSKSDAIRHLLERSAAALGVASLAELRDYYRLPVEGLKTRLQELIESAIVEPVLLEGQRVPYFLHREARLPRQVEGQALLSPFDNLIWERDRTERLFDFRYRLEIYTPGPKREFGYYVLPFLMDETLAARVCLKSDRAADCLKVNSAHGEAGIDPAATAERLAKELRTLASWLGLSHVQVGRRGDLAAAVAREVKAGA